MEKIEQFDIDQLADVIWWIKGYHAASEETCPFNSGHIFSLEKIIITLKHDQDKGD